MSRRPFRLWTGASLRPLESSSCKVVCADPFRPTTKIATRGRDPPPTAGQPWRRPAVCGAAITPRRHDASLLPDAAYGDVVGSVGLQVGDADHALSAPAGELADEMTQVSGRRAGHCAAVSS